MVVLALSAPILDRLSNPAVCPEDWQDKISKTIGNQFNRFCGVAKYIVYAGVAVDSE